MGSLGRCYYTHCAPLERGDPAHKHSIDLSLFWSEEDERSFS